MSFCPRPCCSFVERSKQRRLVWGENLWIGSLHRREPSFELCFQNELSLIRRLRVVVLEHGHHRGSRQQWCAMFLMNRAMTDASSRDDRRDAGTLQIGSFGSRLDGPLEFEFASSRFISALSFWTSRASHHHAFANEILSAWSTTASVLFIHNSDRRLGRPLECSTTVIGVPEVAEIAATSARIKTSIIDRVSLKDSRCTVDPIPRRKETATPPSLLSCWQHNYHASSSWSARVTAWRGLWNFTRQGSALRLRE